MPICDRKSQCPLSLAIFCGSILSCWAAAGFGLPLLPQECRPSVPLTTFESSNMRSHHCCVLTEPGYGAPNVGPLTTVWWCSGFLQGSAISSNGFLYACGGLASVSTTPKRTSPGLPCGVHADLYLSTASPHSPQYFSPQICIHRLL